MNLEHQRRAFAKRIHRLRLQSHDLCQSNFAAYLRAAWPILEPKTPMIENWHQGLLCEYATAVKLGQIKRLLVNIPPRELKSTIFSICFPTWMWTEQAWKRFLFFSYAQTLATKHSIDRRALIQSAWYQRGWSDEFHLSGDQNVKTEFQNNKRGHMIASSMHGAATGKGCDIEVIDDPHDPDHAYRDTTRDSDVRQFDGKLRTRLDDPETGQIIVVMQRLHTKDLSGHVLKTERDEWTWVRIPAIAPTRVVIRFPISGRTKVRESGDVMNPKRYSATTLHALRRSMGEYNFAGQFQQRPSPATGGILKRKWWKYFTVEPDHYDRELISVDCAFKDTAQSAFVCMQAWGKRKANFYKRREIHDRLDFLGTLEALRQLHYAYPNAEIIVEDKANGPAVICSLQNEIPGIVAYTPRDSKEGRARAVSKYARAGNVFLPDPETEPVTDDPDYPTTLGFIEQAAAFPKGDFKDRVDAFSQALLVFMESDPGEYSGNLVPDSEEVETTVVSGRNAGDEW